MRNLLLIISLLCLIFCCTGTPYEPEWVDAIFIMDEQGKQVAPGTYFYKLEYDGNAVVRKMVKITLP